MSEILTPLIPEYTLFIPDTLGALVGWVIILIAVVGLGLYLRERSFRLDRSTLLWLAVLSVLILILTPFVGVLPRNIPIWGSGEVPIQHLMFFVAIPWMMAGGVLGILPATLLAGVSGLLLAYLDTHNIFTPLILMSVALMFSWCVRQRYRTTFFGWLRFPVVAAATSFVAASPLVFIVLALSAPGSTASRMGMALKRFPLVMFSLGGMVLIGGVVCVIVQAIAQDRWGVSSPLRPSPGEVRFRYRLFGFAVPIFLIVLAGALISTWTMAKNHAQKVMLGQLTSTSKIAAENFGLFLEIGENLVVELANEPQVISGTVEDVVPLFEQAMLNLPFFNWVALYDTAGNLVAGWPQTMTTDPIPVSDFSRAMTLISESEHPILLTAQADQTESNSLVDFVVGVGDQYNEPQRILWGQTVIIENVYAQPLLISLEELVQLGGYAHVVDRDGLVLYSAGLGDNPVDFAIGSFSTAALFQSTASNGGTLTHFYQPVDGTGWGIAATLPALAGEEIAWDITYPVVLISAGVMIVIFLAIWLGLSPMVKEMELMAVAINAITMGNFDIEQLTKRLQKKPGYFTSAFHNMIVRQKSRIDQQEKLLSVRGRVAGQLNLQESLHMILAAALTHGACSARMVISAATSDDIQGDPEHRFGVGHRTQSLAELDKAVLNLSRSEGFLTLYRDDIDEKLPIVREGHELTSVVILPLKWKDLRLGVFWIAFSDELAPDDEIVAYLKELARIASMAIVNTNTYQDSQSSMVMMRSVFDLLPDGVLIADHQGQVLLHNAKALSVFEIEGGSIEGKALPDLFAEEDFEKLNLGKARQTAAKEVQFKDGKAFYLLSSPLRITPSKVGQVMIFKDMTQQRKEESLKTEFVTTVSHELRSPLTLILGYAKILRLTGNLNEQQDAYISNIIDGVEEMKGLVQKLLDIGRLEGGDSLDVSQFTAEDVVNKVVESLDAHAKQKNIQIEVDLPGYPLLIEGDQTFITQAIKNLLDNAIKFSKMEGDVGLSVRERDGRVVFAVHDNGIGIAPLDQRNLFKKFTHISTQSGFENEGSGLGLAIVKSIAERHGGRVWLESQLGKGSTFYFEIPRKQASPNRIKLVPQKI